MPRPTATTPVANDALVTLAVEQARWIAAVLGSGDLPAALRDCRCSICERHREGIELRDRANRLLTDNRSGLYAR